MELAQLDVNKYLNDEEQNMLKHLNIQSNHLRKKIKNEKNIWNLSINNLKYNWTITMKKVIDDIFIFIHHLKKYRNYFNDIDDTKNWIDGVFNIIKDFIFIFIKQDRSIYVGFTIIFIGILISIIQITS